MIHCLIIMEKVPFSLCSMLVRVVVVELRHEASLASRSFSISSIQSCNPKTVFFLNVLAVYPSTLAEIEVLDIPSMMNNN